MHGMSSKANSLARWVTVAIALAVTLLSSCLILSLVVGDTFLHEISHASQNLPTDSFMMELRHEDVVTLTPSIHQIPEAVMGVNQLAQTTSSE